MAPKRDANVGRKRIAPDAEEEPKTRRTRASEPAPSKKSATGKADTKAAAKSRASTSAAVAKKTSTTRKSTSKPTTTKSADKMIFTKKRTSDEAEKPPAKRAKTSTASKKAEMPKTQPRAATKSLAVRSKESTIAEDKPAKVAKPKKAPTVKPAKQLPILSSPPIDKLVVLSCGEGSAGELGLGPKAIDVKRPRINALLDINTVGVVQVSTGGMHCIALTHDNKILTWGVNDQGALGRDTSWDGGLRDMDESSDSGSDEPDLNPLESTPTAIPASAFPEGTRFSQVAAGDSCSFAVTDTGLVYGWGTFRDGAGIWGFTLDEDHEIIETQRTPIRIPFVKDILSLSAGSDYVLALDKKGDVYGWGNGQQFQLARKLIERRRAEAMLPTRIPLPRSKKIASIHAGSNHAFAIDKTGEVWSWGLNNFAQTGIGAGAGQDGSTIEGPTKVAALSGLNIKLLSGGSHHTVAVSESGKVFAWGRMDGSQMGINTSRLPLDNEKVVVKDERDRPRILLKPTLVPIPSAAYISAGSDHNIAITKEGKAYTWGFNANYQCGQGTDDDIKEATVISNTATSDKKLTWAGAGGQFSIFAGEPAKAKEDKPLTNGVH